MKERKVMTTTPVSLRVNIIDMRSQIGHTTQRKKINHINIQMEIMSIRENIKVVR